MPDGVLQQVDEDAVEMIRMAMDLQRLRRQLKRDRSGAWLRDRLRGVLQQWDEIEARMRGGEVAGIAAGQKQQLLDQALHRVGRLIHRPEHGSVLVGGSLPT